MTIRFPKSVSVARGPDVLKVRSLTELCGLGVSVEMYIAPKGPLQCKRCQLFGHTQRYCGYVSRCFAGGETRHSGNALPQSSNFSTAAVEEITQLTIVDM